MATRAEQMNNGEDPEQIEADIERTRAELSETLDAIQARLDPSYLKEQATESVKEAVSSAREQVLETAREATEQAIHTAHDATLGRAEHFLHDASDTVTGVGYTMIDTLRDNPIPTALAALGVGWLVVESQNSAPRRRASRQDERSGPYRRTYRSGGEEYGFWHTDREPPAAPGLGERAQEVAQGARSAARGAWERVEDVGEAIPYESVVDRVSQNPLPAALAALGVGWLLLGGSGRSSRERQRYDYERSRYGTPRQGRPYGQQDAGLVSQAQQRAEQLAHEAQQRASGLAHEAQQRASGLADDARHVASDAAQQVSDVAQSVQARAADAVEGVQHAAGDAVQGVQHAAGDAVQGVESWGGEARYFVERVPTRLEQLIEENPLMVGAAALAIGAAIGAGLPLTGRENELFGPRRDELMHRAQDSAGQALHQAQVTAHQVVEKVQHVVTESAEAAKQELQGQDLVGQVKDVAQQALNTAKSAAQEAKRTAEDEAQAQGLTQPDTEPQGEQQPGTPM